MKYSEEQKTEAKKLFLQGFKPPEISEQLDINRRTVYGWVKKGLWGEMLSGQDSLFCAHKRLQNLLNKENKTHLEIKEISVVQRVIEKLENIEIKKQKAREYAETANPGSEGKRSRRKKAFNDFSAVTEGEVLKKFKDGLFEYQLDLWEKRRERLREILKSRQIGMTFYFAREAFADALLTGRNKIFISASRNQSDIFREYIKAFALEWFGVEIRGKDKMEIITPHGTCTFYFLATNAATAQGYHGDVYMDEFFWIPKFEKLNKVASAMASQKQWSRTYFSTPSAMSHDAYSMWSGNDFNERMKRNNKAIIPFPSTKELKKGVFWKKGDRAYRQIITLEDAMKKGCDLFDVEQIKLEYTEREYQQLFMCKFIDDSESVFRLKQLEPCLVESADWKDFKPENERPFGNMPVWIGYDPSRSVDSACIVVLAVPLKPTGKFRVLEKITLKNCNWNYQAATIKDLTKKYNVQYIGIDITGPGSGVFELVQSFWPRVTPIHYSVDSKTKLVLKAQQIIDNRRVEWDASHSDIAAGFMLIRQTSTRHGHITYAADRSDSTGHADAAWAIMHALMNEGLLNPEDKPKSRCSISAA